VVLLIIEHYRKEYEEVFGPLPAVTEKNCPLKATPVLDAPVSRKLWDGMTPGDREAVNRVFSNTGKAIAACHRGF
jgi:cytochrome c peroxidase